MNENLYREFINRFKYLNKPQDYSADTETTLALIDFFYQKRLLSWGGICASYRRDYGLKKSTTKRISPDAELHKEKK
jgi:hypothetical protein